MIFMDVSDFQAGGCFSYAADRPLSAQVAANAGHRVGARLTVRFDADLVSVADLTATVRMKSRDGSIFEVTVPREYVMSGGEPQ
jgi:hypothetical protein